MLVEEAEDALGVPGIFVWREEQSLLDNEALCAQSGSDGRGYVLERLKPLDWAQVMVDVQRFLMTQEDLIVFNKNTIKNLLAFE